MSFLRPPIQQIVSFETLYTKNGIFETLLYRLLYNEMAFLRPHIQKMAFSRPHIENGIFEIPMQKWHFPDSPVQIIAFFKPPYTKIELF